MKPQVTNTGTSFSILPVNNGKKPAVAKKASEPTPQARDTYQSTAPKTSSVPTGPASSTKTSSKPAPSPSAPLLLTPEQRVEAPSVKVENAPQVLNSVEEGPSMTPPEQGLTLLEMAKQTSKKVGRGIQSFFGDQLAVFRTEQEDINKLEQGARQLKTPEQFAAKTAEFKARLAKGEPLDKLRPEAYAVAREAARQATDMRAYDCQVLGALAMDDGHIAEMRTGEGKTLTAVLPLYLNALAGKGAHLVTVNSALAKRDAEWMGPIFKKLGMSVGCVTEDQTPEQKRAGYNCDVTYVTDRALGFDFLRDRQALHPSEKVQRGQFFALVDEVDEVLIDEARTPMIMSTKSSESSADYKLFGDIVKTLIPGDDFKLDEEKRTVWLTDGGLRYVENELVLQEAKQELSQFPLGDPRRTPAQQTVERATLLRGAIRKENAAQKTFDDLDYHKPNVLARAVGMNGEYDAKEASKAEAALKVATTMREQLASKVKTLDLYQEENLHRLPYLHASVKAHTMFHPGKDYTVENGEVKIVDGNKGRVSQGKRYSQGLHQALEAKEGLEIRHETETVSKITMPELIGQYERKAGMTGTGKTSEEEFLQSYGLDVVEIPTNKPVIRKDQPDLVFASKEAKFQAVVDRAMKEASEGRPVLVGTISVNSNRDVAARLLNAGWPAGQLQILNAETVRGGEDNHDPDAGRSGTITLTTGDRAKSVQHDTVNYKKLALDAETKLGEGRPVLLDVDNKKDAEELHAWLSRSVPTGITSTPNAQQGGVQIRVKNPEQAKAASRPEGFAHLDAENYRVDKPVSWQLSKENFKEVLPKAIKAFEDGQPVVLESKSSNELGETAEYLLDHGLDLTAIPMVCDGKEKENVMVGLAGRTGMITVATNMAGRGANIKPDLVAIDHIALAAYEKATQNQATTVTVNKESQAVKLERILREHVGVSTTDSPEVQGKEGQVLIRYGKEMPKLEGENNLHGDDYKTEGLLVVGTERAPSRRIDNQLIGRSGRQGAEGESQFFLSLEDDIPRIYGGEKLEPVLGLFGDSQKGVSSDTVNSFMAKAQERIEGQHYDQRFNASKYADVHRTHRETWYKMRERLLSGEENVVEWVADFAAQGLAEIVREKAGEKRKYDPETLSQALKGVSKDMQLPLKHDEKKAVKSQDLDAVLYQQVEDLLTHPNLMPEKLQAVTLQQIDGIWRQHLEVMDHLQDGIHLEAMAGKKPEEVFPERAFEVFEDTIGALKKQLATVILPAAKRVQNPSPAGVS